MKKEEIKDSETFFSVWKGCLATAGHLSRHKATVLTTQFIPRCSCVVPYGLGLCFITAHRGSAVSNASRTRSYRHLFWRDVRMATLGVVDNVFGPEGWALWVTGLCLSL